MASGSKRSSAGTLGLQATQEAGDALLGRELGRFGEGAVVGLLVLDQVEGEVVAAGADQLEHRVDARCDVVALPAGDLGAVLAGALAELGLRQAGAQARLADQ